MSFVYNGVKAKNLDNLDFLEVLLLSAEGRLLKRTFYKPGPSLWTEGFGIDASSVGLAPIEDSDRIVKPSGNPYVYSLDGRKIGVVTGDVYESDGKLDEAYGRTHLSRLLDKLTRTGMKINVGYELEFFVLNEGEIPRSNGEYMSADPKEQLWVYDLLKFLNECGLEAKLHHHEVGSMQHEITLPYSDPLKTADLLLVYKFLLRRFFNNLGLNVNYMPKPFDGVNGNGLHLHLSIEKNGENVFYDGVESGKLSDEGENAIGGILNRIGEITYLAANTVNSYKRLVPGFEAPVYACWGYGNRSAAIRVPKGRKIDRIELRIPDPLTNPYLLFWSVAKAMIEGMDKRIRPPEPVQKNVYSMEKNELESLGIEVLPSSLRASMEAAKESELLRDLNKALERNFKAKLLELEKYEKNVGKHGNPHGTRVSEWERNYYSSW